MFIKSLLFIPIFLISCVVPDANEPGPVDPPKPDPETGITYTCSTAEHRLQGLCNIDPKENKYCCAVVAPTKKGKSFAEFCEEVSKDGVNLHVDCLSEVITCSQIDQCTDSE